MKFKSDIEVQAGLKDSSGSNGSSGQVLSSDGTTVSWVNAGSSVASDVQNEVKAGVAINKGQAVYVTSADGTNIIVGLASNTSEATSSKTLGLLNATVAINGFADVVQIGKLSGLNTIGANAGDPVWLGANGNLIYGLANKPYAPLHLVFIGIVTRVNANNGEIFVTVQNGFELKEIHDVDLVTNVPINGDVLGYDGTLWVNKTIAEWLGYTPVPNTRALTINGNTQNLTADRTWTIDIGINGSGTVNTLSKFTGTTTIGDSQIKDSGTSVSIGYTTNPNTYKLDVNGDVNINTDLYVSGTFPYTIKAAGGVNIDDALGVYWKTDVGGIGGTLAGIGQSSSGLDFYTNSSFLAPKLKILANGNVTIGTLAGSGSRMVVADATGVLSTQAIPPSGVTSFNTRTGAVTLTSGDVTTALGYTPVTDARTITINGVTQDLAANRSWTVTAPETDTLATVTARGALSTGNMFTPVNGGLFFNGNGVYNTGVYGNGNDLWFNAGSTQKAALNSAGDFTANNSLRAPIFYDSNDTTYYGDFASTSNFNKLLLNGQNSFNTTTPGLASYGLNFIGGTADYANGMTWTWSGTNAQAGVYVQSSGAYGTKMYFATTDSFATGSKTGMSMDHNGTVLVNRSYLQSDSSLRAPIFYDSNNTGYYLDPASASNINTITANEYYSGGWFRNNTTNTGLYNQVNGNHFYSRATNKWGITGNGAGSDIFLDFYGTHQTTYRGSVHADTNSSIGFLTNDGGWGLRITTNKNAYFHGNTVYIGADGQSSSNIIMQDGDEGDRQIHCNSNRIGFLTQAGAWGSYCTDNGDWVTDMISWAGTSMRAPIFYDSNDTGYYADFNSTGTSINIAGSLNAATFNKPAILVNSSGTGSAGSAIGMQQVTAEGWTGIFVDFEPNTGWGLYHDNPSNYFLITAETTTGNIGSNIVPSRSSGNRTAYTKFQFQQTDGVGIAGGSWRAPIFYDYNNTAYYVDPTASSSLKGLTVVDTIYGDITGTAGSLGGRAADRYIWGDGANGRSKGMTSGNANASDPSNSSGFYFGNSVTGMPTGDWWNWLTVAGDSWSGSDGYRWQMAGSFWSNDWRLRRQTSGGWNGWVSLLHSGNYSSYSDFGNNSVYAAVYYDANNTGYYVDPASTSNLNAINFSTLYSNRSGASGNVITIDNAGTGTWPFIFQTSAVGNDNASGFWVGAGGLPDMRLRKDDGTVRALISSWERSYTTYGLTDSTDMRAPIFYDENNTGYYVDPASNSNFNTISVQGGTSNFNGITYFRTNNGGYCGSTDSGKLQAYSDSNNSAFFSFHKGGHYATNMGLDADNVIRIGGWSAGANRLQLDMSGNLTLAGDVTAYSDRRVKENIITVDNALNKVNALRGVYYNRIDSEDKRTKLGVIAQEILEVVPEVVGQDNDGMYNVSYGNLAGLFIEAIKEQQTQIEELKELVNKLINKQ